MRYTRRSPVRNGTPFISIRTVRAELPRFQTTAAHVCPSEDAIAPMPSGASISAFRRSTGILA